jgi:hypothetical protein
VSRLPQPGDAVKATRVLNDRMTAAVGVCDENDFVQTGPLEISAAGVTGEGLTSLLHVYGDLFDVEETLLEAGLCRLVSNHERDLASGGETVESALVAVALQSVAHGVLQERLRWERGS